MPWPHYDEYIARDLVAFIDSRYRTRADAPHRGIAGLSMGGYGAVSLALRYPDVFSAAASHSGVLAPSLGNGRGVMPAGRFDFDSLRAAWTPNLWALLPNAFGKDSVAWMSRDPATMAQRLLRRRPQSMPALLVDCGTDDPYLSQNRAFRDALRASGGQLIYHEHPGAHTWDYWRKYSAESAAWLAARLTVP